MDTPVAPEAWNWPIGSTMPENDSQYVALKMVANELKFGRKVFRRMEILQM
jgi:hypothetical protein